MSEIVPMKLSTAIRLGSMMKPQGFGGLIDIHASRTCAMGAAYEAIGIELGRLVGLPPTSSKRELQAATARQGWDGVLMVPRQCPICDHKSEWLPLIHLNDYHRWTREAIADWVQTIEDAQPVDSPAQEAVTVTVE